MREIKLSKNQKRTVPSVGRVTVFSKLGKSNMGANYYQNLDRSED
jgi:hypothetical protein